MTLLVLGAAILGGVSALFVGGGFVHDRLDDRVNRQLAASRPALASILLEDPATDAYGRATATLGRLPTRVLLGMVESMALDLGDDGYARLRELVAATGVGRRIQRTARSRSWRRRTQAAHVAHLLPDADPCRLRLLDDPHPLVRARAAESLPPQDVVARASQLLEMLDDPTQTVRVAAQQALLRGDARIAAAVCEYLWSGARRGTSLALEIAANLPDPRYGPVLCSHAEDPDPTRRAMVARAIGAGVVLDGLPALEQLLDDPDADVRAAASGAVAALGGTELVGKLGFMITDPSWAVRREAARALDALGAAGEVVLRASLFDDDRYAREIARQILDISATRRQRPQVSIPEALPPLEDCLRAPLTVDAATRTRERA
jgi:HEAT repeat protein